MVEWDEAHTPRGGNQACAGAPATWGDDRPGAKLGTRAKGSGADCRLQNSTEDGKGTSKGVVIPAIPCRSLDMKSLALGMLILKVAAARVFQAQWHLGFPEPITSGPASMPWQARQSGTQADKPGRGLVRCSPR